MAAAAAPRAHVTSSLEAQEFSQGGGRVFPVNPRGTKGQINSAPRQIVRLCSSSTRQEKLNYIVSSVGSE